MYLRMKIGIVLYAVITDIYAESLIRQIGWKGAEVWVMLLLAGVALLGLLVLAAFHFRKRHVQKKDEKEFTNEQFSKLVERTNLNREEAGRIRQLSDNTPMLSPLAIFQSISLFERCIDTEVERICKTRPDSDRLQVEEQILSGIRRKLGFNVLPYEYPLVSTRNIPLGQTGSLFVKGSKNPLIQRATVVDNNEFSLVLQYNVSQEEMYHFTSGDILRFVFTRQNDGFYGIEMIIEECDNAGMLRMRHTLKLKRNQLRQHVRIEVSLPLKFRLLKTIDPDKSEIKRGQVVEAKMADISGGGMSFLCTMALRPGDTISSTFSLPQSVFGGITGKVLRVSLQEGKTQSFYRHHVQFSNLPPGKRERVVKFVFERQRQINQWR